MGLLCRRVVQCFRVVTCWTAFQTAFYTTIRSVQGFWLPHILASACYLTVCVCCMGTCVFRYTCPCVHRDQRRASGVQLFCFLFYFFLRRGLGRQPSFVFSQSVMASGVSTAISSFFFMWIFEILIQVLVFVWQPILPSHLLNPLPDFLTLANI